MSALCTPEVVWWQDARKSRPDAYETVLGFDGRTDHYVLAYHDGDSWCNESGHPISITHFVRLDGPLAPPTPLS